MGLDGLSVEVNWSLYHVSPKIVLKSGRVIVIDGEVSKFVHISVGRVKGMVVADDDIELELAGKSGENVEIFYFEVENAVIGENYKQKSFQCQIKSDGFVKMELLAENCK